MAGFDDRVDRLTDITRGKPLPPPVLGWLKSRGGVHEPAGTMAFLRRYFDMAKESFGRE
jgi:hypothetical protein